MRRGQVTKVGQCYDQPPWQGPPGQPPATSADEEAAGEVTKVGHSYDQPGTLAAITADEEGGHQSLPLLWNPFDKIE